MSDEATNIECLGEVRKGLSAVLKVSVGDYRGRSYIYCRTWEKAEGEEGEGTPRGGLSMNSKTLAALMPLFSRALEAVRERGIERERDMEPMPEQQRRGRR